MTHEGFLSYFWSRDAPWSAKASWLWAYRVVVAANYGNPNHTNEANEAHLLYLIANDHAASDFAAMRQRFYAERQRLKHSRETNT